MYVDASILTKAYEAPYDSTSFSITLTHPFVLLKPEILSSPESKPLWFLSDTYFPQTTHLLHGLGMQPYPYSFSTYFQVEVSNALLQSKDSRRARTRFPFSCCSAL